MNKIINLLSSLNDERLSLEKVFCNGSIHMSNTSEDSDSILIFPFLSDKEKIPKRIPERKKASKKEKQEREESK